MAKQRSPSEERAYKQKRNERQKALKAARAAGIELPPLKKGPPPKPMWCKELDDSKKRFNDRRAANRRLEREAELNGLPLPNFKRGRPRLTEEQKAASRAKDAEMQAFLASFIVFDTLRRPPCAKEVKL